MFSHPRANNLKSLAKVRTTRFAGILALLLFLCTLFGTWALVAVPWWQSVAGSGKVIVYTPTDRAQQVDAQIPGKIERWLVNEGQVVQAGQKLAILRDIDSKFLDPLQVQRTRRILEAYERKRSLTLLRIQALQGQAEAIRQARRAAIPSAEQRILQNRQRLQQASQQLQLSQQNLKTDQLQYKRMKTLEEKGLRSRRDFELAEQTLVRSQTELERTELSIGVAQRDIQISQFDLDRLGAGFDNDLAKIQESSLKAQESLVEIEADLAKAQIEASSLQQRRQQQVVVAPRQGRVVRLLVTGEGETVKVGDALCTLMPAVEDPAVEMYVSDFDAPLVRQGQRVRLMFDGFPAIPFTAFPWAAVGTFAGKVAVVDANADEAGKYRVLVVPDPESDDLPWPFAREAQGNYPLRPGTQAQGWVMMDRPVPLYWELWRRLNAFPPVPMGTDDAEKKSGSPVKPVLKR